MKRARTVFLIGLFAVGIACWPVTTRAGFNYVVTSQRLTLAEKAVDFLSRHWQTRRIARSVVGPERNFEKKIERILAWVNERVQPVPEGFPVVDDHPLHILVRGYGAPDQRSEAFTLLASTSGLPATTALLSPRGSREQIILALVRWEGNLYPVDVTHNLLFRTPQGALAALEDLKRHPEWITAAAGDEKIDGFPYIAYWQEIESVERELSFTRMELQKPWSRLWVSARKTLRLEAPEGK